MFLLRGVKNHFINSKYDKHPVPFNCGCPPPRTSQVLDQPLTALTVRSTDTHRGYGNHQITNSLYWSSYTAYRASWKNLPVGELLQPVILILRS